VKASISLAARAFSMLEIRDIDEKTAPKEANWIVIRVIDGHFLALGSSSGPRGSWCFAPAPFNTKKAAISAAMEWASVHDVGVIYVRTPFLEDFVSRASNAGVAATVETKRDELEISGIGVAQPESRALRFTRCFSEGPQRSPVRTDRRPVLRLIK
jgi:hypothetical protein